MFWLYGATGASHPLECNACSMTGAGPIAVTTEAVSLAFAGAGAGMLADGALNITAAQVCAWHSSDVPSCAPVLCGLHTCTSAVQFTHKRSRVTISAIAFHMLAALVLGSPSPHTTLDIREEKASYAAATSTGWLVAGCACRPGGAAGLLRAAREHGVGLDVRGVSDGRFRH